MNDTSGIDIKDVWIQCPHCNIWFGKMNSHYCQITNSEITRFDVEISYYKTLDEINKKLDRILDYLGLYIDD